MNASATKLLSGLGMDKIDGNMTINDAVKMLHRGGSRCGSRGGSRGGRGGSRRRRRHSRRHSRSNVNKKYTWPFW